MNLIYKYSWLADLQRSVCVTVLRTMLSSSTMPAYLLLSSLLLSSPLLASTFPPRGWRLLASTVGLCIVAIFGYYHNPATYSPIRQGNRYVNVAFSWVREFRCFPYCFRLTPASSGTLAPSIVSVIFVLCRMAQSGKKICTDYACKCPGLEPRCLPIRYTLNLSDSNK